MVVYNITGLFGNVSSVSNLVTISNTASNGLLVGLFILAIWLVLLLAFLRLGDFLRAFTGSSFVVFLISIFAVYLDWLNILFLLAFLFFSAVGTFLLYLEE